jgi:hypothetical protein
MASYRMRVRTPQPATETFAYVSDLTHFADWDPGIASSDQVAGDGPGVGAEYDVEASGSTLRYVVEVYDSPHRVRAKGRNRWLTSIDTITVTPDGDGSIVSYDADLQLHGLLRIGDPLLAVSFKRMGDRARDGMADKLDGTILD